MTSPIHSARLRQFVQQLAGLLDRQPSESEIIQGGGELLRDLVAHDDWLPEAWAQPSPLRYQQYLLHADALNRFSVVSFVWGPGQSTPIHDHTVWGLIGVLRGAELSHISLPAASSRIMSSIVSQHAGAMCGRTA